MRMFDRIIFFTAIVANSVLLAFAAYLSMTAYGSDARFALILFFPPLLSLAALVQTGGIEERRLRKQVRKASLKKQIKELEEFLK